MRRLKSITALAALLGLAVGCKTDMFSGLFRDPEAGVPLSEFTAKDGRYFPPFVETFFPGARRFYQEFPSVGTARADLKMIEIKQLNHDDSKFNEANLSWSADGVYLGFEVITG